MNSLKIFVPLTKIDEEKRLVYGVLAEEAVDKSGEIFDYASSKANVLSWSESFKAATASTGQEPSAGNLRSMHTGLAAGKFVSVGCDDATKSVPVCAHVVDDQEWAKTKAGVYTGFSIGGGYVKRWKDEPTGKVRYTASLAEGSLVDNPCMYGATFAAIKSDGAQELRKFAGTPTPSLAPEQIEKLDAAVPALAKDAVAAIGDANDAIASLKSLAVELLSMPGEPDTWTLSDILAAIRYAIYGKITAEGAAAEEAEGAPGEGPDEPATLAAAAAVGDLAKAEEIDMKTEELTKVLTTTIGEALGKALTPITETIAKVQDAVKPDALYDAVKDGVAKTVGETVAKAVEPLAKAADVATLAEKVKKLEDAPAPVGTPISKTIGSSPTTQAAAAEQVTKIIEDQLAKAKSEGASAEQLATMRKDLTVEFIKSTR
jgi:hypothetical protein